MEGYNSTPVISAQGTIALPVFEVEKKQSPEVRLSKNSRRRGQGALGEEPEAGPAKFLVLSGAHLQNTSCLEGLRAK